MSLSEMKKSHERLSLSEMAMTAAQIQIQLLEDNEAGHRRTYVDELSRAKVRHLGDLDLEWRSTPELNRRPSTHAS